MSNRRYFEEDEYQEWKKEVEETGEYDLWELEQLAKKVELNLTSQFKQIFGETNG
jgi:hypothetical protein